VAEAPPQALGGARTGQWLAPCPLGACVPKLSQGKPPAHPFPATSNDSNGVSSPIELPDETLWAKGEGGGCGLTWGGVDPQDGSRAGCLCGLGSRFGAGPSRAPALLPNRGGFPSRPPFQKRAYQKTMRTTRPRVAASRRNQPWRSGRVPICGSDPGRCAGLNPHRRTLHSEFIAPEDQAQGNRCHSATPGRGGGFPEGWLTESPRRSKGRLGRPLRRSNNHLLWFCGRENCRAGPSSPTKGSPRPGFGRLGGAARVSKGRWLRSARGNRVDQSTQRRIGGV